jgi:hypothetical protein
MSDSQTEHAALMRTRDREGAMAKVDRKESAKNYKGFVAGVFSGIAKLTGMFTYFVLSLLSIPVFQASLIGQFNLSSVISHKFIFIREIHSIVMLTASQLATPSTQSKSDSKPPTNPDSPVPSNASSLQSAKKVSSVSTKAPRLPL